MRREEAVGPQQRWHSIAVWCGAPGLDEVSDAGHGAVTVEV